MRERQAQEASEEGEEVIDLQGEMVMLSNIRKHLTPSTGIALIALVFALTSGAFAATGGGSPGNTTMGGSSRASDQTLALISKAKTKAKAGPRGPAGPKGATGATGPAGATGATGPQGPQGTPGATGQTGATGSAGANGEGVTSKPVPTGNVKCGGLGGVEYTASGKATLVCNGQEGSPWTAGGTLPAGKTETGSWAATGETLVPISFNIQLLGPLDEEHVLQSGETGFASHCPGTAEAPGADEGYLCVYIGTNFGGSGSINAIAKPGASTFVTKGASSTGAIVYTASGTALMFGTWAVTAA